MTTRIEIDEEHAWALLRQLARRARRGEPIGDGAGVRLDGNGALEEVAEAEAWLVAEPAVRRGWRWGGAATGEGGAELLFDIYAPLCVGASSRDLVVGHLGQTLDGRIATLSGVSQFITGEENLVHAHRMRALFDAVLVGARTVREDDPRLTTRLVPGEHPTRVVLDPRRRLGSDRRVFQDETAPTLLFCAAGAAAGASRHGLAEVIGVETHEGRLSCAAVLAELGKRGLRRVFIEGGGVTVSRFLQARALHRLHVAVAPMLLGSGRPSFSLPVVEDLSGALSFSCRHFVTGQDILFDCELVPAAGER